VCGVCTHGDLVFSSFLFFISAFVFSFSFYAFGELTLFFIFRFVLCSFFDPHSVSLCVAHAPKKKKNVSPLKRGAKQRPLRRWSHGIFNEKKKRKEKNEGLIFPCHIS
jgi:hypothetical protein